MAINWAGEKLSHGYTEKATTNPSLCKWSWTDLLYICAYILPFNNHVQFFIQSLQIVRNMQNSIEARSNLCTELVLR